ncbi:RHS repeat-associated core domain-containing protein [Rodentibacter caecimuris]|uniref:RHS repeat-associated core domain-containing protein n=1 Tax=Rodentibacter caecimuris TaxID=1796644 RepID=UPI00277B5BA2|nr:RHS repeat-associated core domain-containing protein [Rodentibacter heylii]
MQEIRHDHKNGTETNRTFTYIYRHPNSYEPLAQCLARTDGQGNRIEHEVNYFHCDQIGIPREMTDSDGKLIWRGRYDAWGGFIRERYPKNTAGIHQPFRLQNQYYDEETGLHYNFLRYYDPITGRFMTQDPIGLKGGMNLYQFAPNVQAWVDPLGLARFCTRALKALPGSSDIDPNFRGGLDLGFFHEHIFYDDGTNIGYGGDGLFSETSIQGYKCSSTHYDDETMRQAVNNVKNRTKPTLEKADNGEIVIRNNPVFGNDNYSLLMNNCQDFATEVEKDILKIKKVKYAWEN